MAKLRQRFERAIEELLILLSCLVAYVVEQFNGVASCIYEHTEVYNVNNGCTFSFLHPSQGNGLHDWHDRFNIPCASFRNIHQAVAAALLFLVHLFLGGALFLR